MQLSGSEEAWSCVPASHVGVETLAHDDGMSTQPAGASATQLMWLALREDGRMTMVMVMIELVTTLARQERVCVSPAGWRIPG